MMETLYLGMTATEIRTLQQKVASAEVLLVAAKHIQGILQHPTRSVTILDAGKLDDAISAYDKISEGKHDTE